MSDQNVPGTITWCDLTVKDADAVREFYSAVAGWQVERHNMGDYEDYSMVDAQGAMVAGVCHARGTNAKMPAQWLIYITVENLDDKARRCRELGGKVLDGPRDVGQGRFCVIQDPAGAVAALYETA